MQRLNAASCLLLALLARPALPWQGDRVKVQVVQTHSGIRIGDGSPAEPGLSASTMTRCKGTSGIYSREYGYYCNELEVKLEPKEPLNHQSHVFFYDVNVIMPDRERVTLHCSSIPARTTKTALPPEIRRRGLAPMKPRFMATR
jgi:hypothetical protein